MNTTFIFYSVKQCELPGVCVRHHGWFIVAPFCTPPSSAPPPPKSLETQFRLSVFYRGVKVLEQLVENECGFRLVFR